MHQPVGYSSPLLIPQLRLVPMLCEGYRATQKLSAGQAL